MTHEAQGPSACSPDFGTGWGSWLSLLLRCSLRPWQGLVLQVKRLLLLGLWCVFAIRSWRCRTFSGSCGRSGIALMGHTKNEGCLMCLAGSASSGAKPWAISVGLDLPALHAQHPAQFCYSRIRISDVRHLYRAIKIFHHSPEIDLEKHGRLLRSTLLP